MVYCIQYLTEEHKSTFTEYMIAFLNQANLSLRDTDKNLVDIVKLKNLTTTLMYFLISFCSKCDETQGKESSDLLSKPKATKTSKSKKGGVVTSSFVWTEWRHECLILFDHILQQDIKNLYPLGIVDENFLSTIWKYVMCLLEKKPSGINGTSAMDVQCRNSCLSIMKYIIQYIETLNRESAAYITLLTVLVESIRTYEHMGHYIAECTAILSSSNLRFPAVHHPNYNSSMSYSIMVEISRMNLSDQKVANGVKYIGIFLTSFSELNPEQFLAYLPLLLPQLDAEVYFIR